MAKKMDDWYRGYRDALDGEPWRYSPFTEDEWIEDPLTVEADERDRAYWDGFDHGAHANFVEAAQNG